MEHKTPKPKPVAKDDWVRVDHPLYGEIQGKVIEVIEGPSGPLWVLIHAGFFRFRVKPHRVQVLERYQNS